jgi:magnesium chelatase family protein
VDTATALAQVADARLRQAVRNAPAPARLNADLGPRETTALGESGEGARRMLRDAARKLGLSARAYHRTLRVARTISDVEGAEQVGSEQIAEALRYRPRGEGGRFAPGHHDP